MASGQASRGRRGNPIHQRRAAARIVSGAEPHRHRVGHHRRGIWRLARTRSRSQCRRHAGAKGRRAPMGTRDSWRLSCLRCRVFPQTVGRPNAEGGRPDARRPDLVTVPGESAPL